MINFSGSDWCIPCIKMEKEIFDNIDFKQYCQHNLVFINADFPCSKKHQLSKELQLENEHFADVYNSEGTFPYTLLLDTKGNILKTWNGLPKESLSDFISEIDHFIQNVYGKK